ncbi:hypothetical protein MLD38_031865 [Melastoma candidum]|uniref:Uncharacterized protein n=1 Tax=Melastoma candidum TaxID=119954 RepID=A0ACB9MQH0_9MYRT|nr:hypothetical protein MLD38_031865 [Melastoma candidum]
MAKLNLLLFLGLFALSEFCAAQEFSDRVGLRRWRGRSTRFGGFQQGKCQIHRLDALEPDNRVESEAGLIETWSPHHEQLRCAGVALSRHTIEPDGLLLPSYTNAAQLIYVVEGSGIQGVVIPGCPETFQTSQQPQFGFHGQRFEGEFGFRRRSREEFGRRGRFGGRFQDQHQKIRRFRRGDIIALPAGVPQWIYNDGSRPLVTVNLLDVTNNANQLDLNPRRFYLAGNPENEHEEEGGRWSRQSRRQERFRPFGQEEEGFTRRVHRRRRGSGQQNCNNILCGLDTEFLAEAFNTDIQTAEKLQNVEASRNNIVRVQGGLKVLRPPFQREEEEREGGGRRMWSGPGGRSFRRGYSHGYGGYESPREWGTEESRRWGSRGRSYYGGRYGGYGGSREWGSRRDPSSYGGYGWGRCNGLEETVCSMRLREQIGHPSRADLYTPGAGHISTVDSHNLPILFWLQLSATHGVLHNNALLVPHYNLNAHSICYVIRGRARIQVVDDNGRNVFDDEVSEGQVVVIPQGFAVVKKAEGQRFEWVSFKTNDNAMMSQLAGRTSVLRALPDEVVANAFQVSREEARQIKYSRRETALFQGGLGYGITEMRAEA